jgi:hypothetical protein
MSSRIVSIHDVVSSEVEKAYDTRVEAKSVSYKAYALGEFENKFGTK